MTKEEDITDTKGQSVKGKRTNKYLWDFDFPVDPDLAGAESDE